jgi:hypothetical protein
MHYSKNFLMNIMVNSIPKGICIMWLPVQHHTRQEERREQIVGPEATGSILVVLAPYQFHHEYDISM